MATHLLAAHLTKAPFADDWYDAVIPLTPITKGVERRNKFQAGIQDFVDIAISWPINLPAWGSDLNWEKVKDLSPIGSNCHPNSTHGSQPLTSTYCEAPARVGLQFKVHDSCKVGVGGV